MTGADTTYNTGYIRNVFDAPQGSYTIQSNGLVGDLIAPHIRGGLTNFIGCINGLSCPHGGETVTIVSGFLFCGFK